MRVKDCLCAAKVVLNQIFVNYFQEWHHKETNRFISTAIQNQILNDIAIHIRRPIVKNIKESSYYSIMTDEATDIINKEQFVIYIRWVDNGFNPNEDLIGLHKRKNFGIYQKQPSRCVLKKRCSANIQQIYIRTPMPKRDFNKVALQLLPVDF